MNGDGVKTKSPLVVNHGVKKRKTDPAPKPAPDLRSATREVLAKVADWMGTRQAELIIFAGVSAAGTSRAEWDVLIEAKAIAMEYVRTGARL